MTPAERAPRQLDHYVRDNPTTLTDPDGHAAWPGEIASFFRDLACSMTNFSCSGQSGQSSQVAADQTKEPGAKAQQKLTEQLKFRTVGRSHTTWEIRWSLTRPSGRGGWIVQHMTIHVRGHGGHGGRTYDYWEAWRVPAGSRFTTYHGHVAYDDEFYSPTRGTTFYGRARFYPGLMLPNSFTPFNPATAAHALPSATVNPHLPTVDATAINQRWWETQ